MESTLVIRPLIAKRVREVPDGFCEGSITTDPFFKVSGADIAIKNVGMCHNQTTNMATRIPISDTVNLTVRRH